MLSDYDLYLLSQGNHHRSYEVMGEHEVVESGPGVRFAVWARHRATG